MATLSSIRTAVPKFSYSNVQIEQAGAPWLGNDSDDYQLFLRFVRSSHTLRRHFVLPLESILALSGASERASVFERAAPELAGAPLLGAIEAAALTPEEIDTFIFTSCTSPSIPSVDGILVQQAGLSNKVNRLPVYQFGCAGGVIGLALANRFADAGKRVLVTSVELCSLVFYAGDRSRGHLVGCAIFGDGTASAVVDQGTRGLRFRDAQSFLIPDTRHLMGYDILDDGAHLRLDRDLPRSLAATVPHVVEAFLRKNRLHSEEVPWWLFHPGGTKILSYLENAFGLRPEQCSFARDVLENVGNISSSTIFFVTERFLSSAPYCDGDHVLLLGIGPGLTIELILFQCGT